MSSALRASRRGCLTRGRAGLLLAPLPGGPGWDTPSTGLGAKEPAAKASIGACYRERKSRLGEFTEAWGGRPHLPAGRRVEGTCKQGRPGCPSPPAPAGLTEDEDVRAMLRGSRLCKIRSRTWQKERLYRLQEDGLSVWFQRRIPRAPSQHICELGPGRARAGWGQWRPGPAALTRPRASRPSPQSSCSTSRPSARATSPRACGASGAPSSRRAA